jgi:hypothetical protein
LSFVKKVCCIFIFCFFAIATFAQNVATVNGKSISSKEFMWVYKKNHAGITSATYPELANYLSLYINFKLKVLDAKAQNLDADTAYKKEINGYENMLKKQRKTASKNFEYDFIMNEYREGVLMFNISEKKIWNKVLENEQAIRDRYNKFASNYNGKSFEEVQAQIIADYQQDLENEWIKALRAKYTVKVNEEELKKLAKQ